MTRKEEIQRKAGSIADGMKQHYAPQSECKGYYEGFIDGGKYADSTMIEKSFMWFLKHGLEYIDVNPIGDCGSVEFNSKIKDMYEAYKKAMEE